MKTESHDRLELKLKRLEEVLVKWKEETTERDIRLEKRLINGIIKYVCIVVAALGAIWSVVELVDWYWSKYELEELAAAYARSADEGYLQTRNPAAALEIINTALEITPDDPDLRYKHIYYQCHAILEELPADRYQYSAEDLKKLDMLSVGVALQKKLTPENGELYLLEALLFRRQGKYEESIAALEIAIAKGAEYPYAEYLIIRNLINLKRPDEAEQRAEKLAADYAQSKFSHSAGGRVQIARYRYIHAAEAFEKALETDPAHYDSLHGLAGCIASIIPRDYQKERRICKNILSYYPKDFAAYRRLIRSYIHEGNYVLADIYLKKAERLFSGKGELYVLQAELFIKERKFDLAEKACLHAFQLIPEDVNVQRQLVTLYIASGNFGKALEYNRVLGSIAEEMNDARRLNNIAWYFYLLGSDYTYAEKLASRSVSLNSGNSYCWGTLASIRFRMGKHQEALESVDKAVAVAGEARKPVHLVEKALMLIDLKRAPEALTILQQVQKHSPGYYRLYQALGEYYILTGNLTEAQKAVAEGRKMAVNSLERSELQVVEAKINAASGKWQQAQILQRKALENIDNLFSEIRIAWYNYAVYSWRAGDQAEAEKAIAILKTIDSKNKETLELEEELSCKTQ